MAQAPLRPGARLRIKHASQTVAAKVDSIDGRLDVNSGEHGPADELALNDIGLAHLRLAAPIAADSYAANRDHRQLHPHRRLDQRHRRRGHGRLWTPP